MNNLTRLLDRESKWYKLGPFVVSRGIPKKLPLYFFLILGLVVLGSIIPYSPFWLIAKMDIGWMFLFFILPFLGATWLQGMKKAGKSPERYVWSMIRFTFSPKHVNPYQPIGEAAIYRFGTTYTIKKFREESDDESTVD